ncbi:MAG TPA: mechanosensitive ion channel protein MscS [Oceanospirillaceae bacterium]|nr:mechanosensitive ion channel protein MscS [Oceanospirillaceae bacterium]
MDLSFSESWFDIALDGAIAMAMAVAIFYIGRWLALLMAYVVGRSLKARATDATLSAFVSATIRVVLTFVALLIALDSLGVDTTALLTIFAAAGLALGLALKDTLSNFAAGVMLIIARPFTVGDFIEAAGVAGVVEKIGYFSSQMKTGDNREIIVPNNQIYGGVIVNASAKPTRRIDLIIGVGYGDDLPKAEHILLQCIAADQRILAEPDATVAVAELADSSVNFIVRPWVKATDYWAVRWHLTKQIKLAFDENDISMPYPQQDIHLHQTPATASTTN